MQNPKFEYGACHEVHPTHGMDVEKGMILIQGVVNFEILPKSEADQWLTGDAEYDWEITTNPWYYIQRVDEDFDPISYLHFLPEFALEEIIEEAKWEKEKARKKIEFNKKIEIIRSIVLG
jgi:hypothetical protein